MSWSAGTDAALTHPAREQPRSSFGWIFGAGAPTFTSLLDVRQAFRRFSRMESLYSSPARTAGTNQFRCPAAMGRSLKTVSASALDQTTAAITFNCAMLEFYP